jgi:hypothetical protein
MLKDNLRKLVHSLWVCGVNPFDAVKIIKATGATHEDIVDILEENDEEAQRPGEERVVRPKR